MPRAGPSRSQPSQHHSQRTRGRRADSEDDDDSENDSPNANPDDDVNIDASQPRRTQGGDSDDVSLRIGGCAPLAHAHLSYSISTERRAS